DYDLMFGSLIIAYLALNLVYSVVLLIGSGKAENYGTFESLDYLVSCGYHIWNFLSYHPVNVLGLEPPTHYSNHH
ncbi:unnamed protein product, partial [Allacma fusca]